MRFAALLSSFLLVGTIEAAAQTQAKPPATQPGASQPKPAARPPAQRRPAARSGMAITVTNPEGATLEGIHVEVMGPTLRNGDTDPSGQINFPGMQAGTYRVRFTGEKVLGFEREVTLRAGQVADIDVSLTPAPEPPPPPPLPAPAEPEPEAPTVGPTGEPLTVSIEEFLDREFVGREPRRESLISCSGNARTTMIQLNEAMPQRLYENADIVYYVLGGEGTVTLDGRDQRVPTNEVVSVPRGTAHSFERRGSRPLILLAVLSGEPCERAR